MTPEQRYDLAIEWRLTSNTLKEAIKHEYIEQYGPDIPDKDHWEKYLVKVLNLERFWRDVGLL